MIACALVLEPLLLICDEPTTALDVTTQAQILALIRDLQRRRGTAVLFITHDFGVVSEIADQVVVVQTGRIVESGPARQVLAAPQHAYTAQLIAAIPNGKAPGGSRGGRRRRPAGAAGPGTSARPTAPAKASSGAAAPCRRRNR